MSSEDQNQSPTKPIPFITFDSTSNKFIISEEAKKIICKPSYTKVGIISLVGKYRTGKSFLLNRVLKINQLQNKQKIENPENNNNDNTQGFDVGPTIRPCTKGIWLWSNPIIIQNNHSENPFPAFLIDTEGLGAYDEEINHDSKIFLIAILISSLFIYNSFGTIDENALNNLSLILNLSKNVKLRNSSFENEEEEMGKYFPSLLWLLRDFALKLEDNEGNVITAKQYLENALMEQKGMSDIIIEKNQVRKLIKTYFPERDCFPLVRPVENENDLQNLQNLPDDNIRPEFLSQSETLINKIFKKTKPKNFNKKILSGEMLFSLIESVINSINEGAIPVIENSWKYVIGTECMKSVNETIKEYKNNIIKYQKENLDKSDYFSLLEKYNQELTNKLIDKFKNENSSKFDDINEYVRKLKIGLSQEFKKINEDNYNLLKDKYISELDKEINKIISDKDKLTKENYITFINELLQSRDKVDNLIPDFLLKQQIAFDKIINAIKKYIEEFFVKSKNEIENKISSINNEKEIIESKYKNLNEEYEKDKKEYKQYIDKYNEMLIEYKLINKSNEGKIKNFENEKKTLKETHQRNFEELKKETQSKIEKYTMEIEKLKNDIKTKDEEILLNKLNNEKVSALNIQKIQFLDKELGQWKERYNTQSKDFSEAKSQLINLTAENDKLNGEIQSLKNKIIRLNKNNNNLSLLQSSDNLKDNIQKMYLSTDINLSNSENSFNNILKNQNEIKEYIEKLKNIISILVSNNKDLLNNSKINIPSLTNLEDNIPKEKEEKEKKKEEKLISNAFSYQKPIPQGIPFKNVKFKTERKNFNKPKINIINTILKKDEYGKPYLDYVCEVIYNDKEWKLLKKFNQFALLNNALKNLFKDVLNLPNTGSLFTNINDMTGNSFHENKINQLDKFINELTEIDEVCRSVPFRNFFELDEEHIQIDNYFKSISLEKDMSNNLNENKNKKQQVLNPRKFNVFSVPKKK